MVRIRGQQSQLDTTFKQSQLLAACNLVEQFRWLSIAWFKSAKSPRGGTDFFQLNETYWPDNTFVWLGDSIPEKKVVITAISLDYFIIRASFLTNFLAWIKYVDLWFIVYDFHHPTWLQNWLLSPKCLTH